MPRLRARSSSTWKIRQSLPAMPAPDAPREPPDPGRPPNRLPKPPLERREQVVHRDPLAQEPAHGIAVAADPCQRGADRGPRRAKPAGDAQHGSGVETGAPARGRTENGAAISLPRPFWRKST